MESTQGLENTERLSSFLQESIFPDSASLAIEHMAQASGGASWETYLVDLRLRTGGDERAQRIVLKRAPKTGPMAPYEIGKDIAIFSALASSEIPVPRLLSWSEDESVFERPFTVTEFIEGASHDVSKVERWSLWQSSREDLGNAIIDVAAALTRFRWQDSELVDVLGPRGSSAARLSWMIDRYLARLLLRSEEEQIPQVVCREIAAWLREHVHDLPEESLVLVHGDFRFGNFIFQDLQIAAVLDWERAMLGDPMSNLGFFCMPMMRIRQPDLMGKALTFGQVIKRYRDRSELEVSIERVQFYAIFWQFLELVNSTRNATEIVITRHGGIGSRSLLTPNLLTRQTLNLIDNYDRGVHDLF
jgi:aminoglycoside phosphotransferase (APT) family kinase protein